MQKFSFEEKKDILIPVNATFRPPTDANGVPIAGDDLLKKFGKIITTFEGKHKRPVPIQDQKFIAWVKQTCKKLEAGETSENIFKSTLV